MRVEHSQQQADLVKSGLAGAVKGGTPKTAFASVLAQSSEATNGTSGSNTSPAEQGKKTERAIPKGPKGETTRAVKDHPAYVEIMSGPRNGMFINMTNNERRGEAFTLVRREDRDLHIYGTGKDRRVIISWHKDQPAHQNDAAKDSQDATKPATGGTSPSSQS
jgi:hypothetical protein